MTPNIPMFCELSVAVCMLPSGIVMVRVMDSAYWTLPVSTATGMNAICGMSWFSVTLPAALKVAPIMKEGCTAIPPVPLKDSVSWSCCQKDAASGAGMIGSGGVSITMPEDWMLAWKFNAIWIGPAGNKGASVPFSLICVVHMKVSTAGAVAEGMFNAPQMLPCSLMVAL